MFQSGKIKRFFSFVMLTTLLCSVSIPVNAKVITTPSTSISKNTNVPKFTVTVNSAEGTRTYRIFGQSSATINPKGFLANHGCALCSLTTVLTSYCKKYANYTPSKVRKIVEKKYLGYSAWRANYSKSMSSQRPVSLYGITKILNKNGIKASYVRRFKNASAVKAITTHLKKGKPVIIEANNRKQVNGKVVSSYTDKWAGTKHTMVLLGMTNTGKVIVADSATRAWSGTKQRIKFANMNSLVKYMYPCTSSSSSVYYNSSTSSGGYILVK